ncbi:MAG TPA: hypothetical protein VGJ82_01130 [Thermoanaerobaculia bacterium]|jgi:hypothetical protein
MLIAREALIVAVIAVALLVWVASWFWNKEAVVASASRPWPVTAAHPTPQRTNDAALKLTALAKALPRSEAVDAFVSHEIARGELAIGRLPALPDVTAIGELLLSAPVIGGGDEIEARRKTALIVTRALGADALSKESWDDLHAAWYLARSLDGHPQTMAQTAALAMARMINAAAWKMPLPVPIWFAEVQERDDVRPLQSFQFQTASY